MAMLAGFGQFLYTTQKSNKAFFKSAAARCETWKSHKFPNVYKS